MKHAMILGWLGFALALVGGRQALRGPVGQVRQRAIRLRRVTERDAAAWARMRCALWPEAAEAEHMGEIADYFAGTASEPQAVLVAETASMLVGLAELSVRSTAEGCTTGRVAYLEGWFIDRDSRRQGVGRALVAAAEDWGRQQGCREFGSDTQAENEASAAAHRALGFEDAGLVRTFRKDIRPKKRGNAR